jgi:hypothetical protein
MMRLVRVPCAVLIVCLGAAGCVSQSAAPGTVATPESTMASSPPLSTTSVATPTVTPELTPPPQVVQTASPLQDGNDAPVTYLRTSSSGELEDNRIGIHISCLHKLEPEAFPDGRLTGDHIFSQGVTRARLMINNGDWGSVRWDKPEIPIDPRHDRFITELADEGLTLTFVLIFWDKEFVAQGGHLGVPRFKTEDEIQRYLDYVRYMVDELHDRVEYFEIWNEPNGPDSIQSINVDDYIQLVSRAAPVIREVAPDAKIVVGGPGELRQEDTFEYLSRIIESDEIMPLVDVVSWHGMYDVSPEFDYFRDYYYGYPDMIAQIRETAESHGFAGEYVSDEMSWRTFESPCFCHVDNIEALTSQAVAAKNYARGILLNRGLDVSVSQFYIVPNQQPTLILRALRVVSTVMSGSTPVDFPVDITSDLADIATYTFSAPSGDLLVAVWDDAPARDEDPGVSSTVIVRNVSTATVTAVNTVLGHQQELAFEQEGGDLLIRDLVITQAPLVLRISG